MVLPSGVTKPEPTQAWSLVSIIELGKKENSSLQCMMVSCSFSYGSKISLTTYAYNIIHAITLINLYNNFPVLKIQEEMVKLRVMYTRRGDTSRILSQALDIAIRHQLYTVVRIRQCIYMQRPVI